MIPELRVIVGTELVWDPLGGDGCVEHSTQCQAIHIAGVCAEADDAPRELVHDHEHPVALQVNGFTPKQVDAPEAVLRVSQEAQP